MYPYIHIILPTYFVMAIIGGILSLFILYFRLEKYNIQFSRFLFLVLICIFGCVIGSKVLFAITQIPWLIKHFSIFNLLLLIPQSGFVFYGGLFGVIFVLMLLTAKDKDYRERVFKLFVPAMPLFHAFGRIGCFFAGCCYGKPLSSRIIIGPIVISRIPIQIIECIAELAIFVVVIITEKNKPKIDLLRLYLVLYAVIRFINEFMRGDEIRGAFLGLSTSQWISMLILLYYFIDLIKSYLRKNAVQIVNEA